MHLPNVLICKLCEKCIRPDLCFLRMCQQAIDIEGKQIFFKTCLILLHYFVLSLLIRIVIIPRKQLNLSYQQETTGAKARHQSCSNDLVRPPSPGQPGTDHCMRLTIGCRHPTVCRLEMQTLFPVW